MGISIFRGRSLLHPNHSLLCALSLVLFPIGLLTLHRTIFHSLASSTSQKISATLMLLCIASTASWNPIRFLFSIRFQLRRNRRYIRQYTPSRYSIIVLDIQITTFTQKLFDSNQSLLLSSRRIVS